MNRFRSTLLLIGLSLPIFANELSMSVANRVHTAISLQQEEKTEQAIEVLKSIKTNKAYDIGYVQQMLGILYWQNHQVQNAQTALFMAVGSQGLPLDKLLKTQRMLGDILLSEEKYLAALEQYEIIITTLNTNSQNDSKQNNNKQSNHELLQTTYFRVAQINYQQQNWTKVLDTMAHYQQLKSHLDVSDLILKLGSHLALEQWMDALSVTARLRGLEPHNAQWWQQQYNLQLQLKQYRQALSSLKQYQRAGFILTQAQYKAMAQLYAQQEAPELAARIYQEHIENKDAQDWATEARYWQQAEVPTLALQAWSEASELDVRHHWSYVQMLLHYKRYQEVIIELDSLSALTQPQWLVKAQAYYQLGLMEMAKKSATQAHQLKPDVQTKQWLVYLAHL